ncbi:uncharacterized protein LOC114357298 [Ostrinia furnacalis]|uniref:uncharacterized protein LOC114357298 n=1 Tax=Ostrinia furnacalis TaxID=93504 RepID=UPI00103BE466|nr:uncharacterized protein LOC114357298 [Ostrinia furnacalis]
MPVLDVSNPKVINFLLENYEKESRLRMKWIQLHAGNFAKAATFTREERNYTKEDITKTVIEAGMIATTRDHITAARHRTTAPIPDYLLAKVGATDKEVIGSMKPVAREVKDTLQESTFEYLKKRSKLKPEDKYNFTECSNWMYGWQLAESEIRMSGPAHGQVHHLLRNLRSRVGPQRDPDHYGAPDIGHTLFATM